jgi:nucleotide-binding universal stress UspA family protein
MFQRILVGTDFSPNADAAWRCAVDLARRLGADLRLVHVAMPTSVDAPEKVSEYGFGVAKRLLEERAATAALASRVKTILSRGEPAHALAAIAREEDIDLVVVGTHGHRQAGDILVGSVAERLIRLAPCTVVVVKPTEASVDAAI